MQVAEQEKGSLPCAGNLTGLYLMAWETFLQIGLAYMVVHHGAESGRPEIALRSIVSKMDHEFLYCALILSCR